MMVTNLTKGQPTLHRVCLWCLQTVHIVYTCYLQPYTELAHDGNKPYKESVNGGNKPFTEIAHVGYKPYTEYAHGGNEPYTESDHCGNKPYTEAAHGVRTLQRVCSWW